MSGEQFLHGVEVVEIDDGLRPIETIKSSIIGMVGTAPDADAEAFPINTPVLIAGKRTEAAPLGKKGSLPWAMDAVFDQTGAMVVVVRVENSEAVTAEEVTRGSTDSDTLSQTPVETISRVYYAGRTYSKGTDYQQIGNSLVWNTVTETHTETLTRSANDTDVLNKLPAIGITAVKQGLKYYRKGIDYKLSANGVQWLGQEQPAGGESYSVIYTQDVAPQKDAIYSVDYRVTLADNAVLSNIIGGVNSETGQYEGLQALLAAQSQVKVTPRILCVPGFGHETAVISELLGIAERMRAVIVADGPNTTDAEAISFREQFGSPRVYIVDPWVKVWDTELDMEVMQPASPRVAGMISKSDNDRGFWWSPSNQEINGITGPARHIDFALGDSNARANYLNENHVATIIQQDGFRLWGNRSCAHDQKWMFLNVRRTADMINESLLHAHLWAVDRNISRTYVNDVLEGVRNYLRHLTAIGAIIGGDAWADPELNTPDQIMQGKVYIDFDFSANYPAEHIIFRSHLVDGYLEEIFKEELA